MPNQAWRRFHGELIAEVVAMWPDRYRVIISNGASGLTEEVPRVYVRLESAKASADALVRRAFRHRCDTDSCGAWFVWSV